MKKSLFVVLAGVLAISPVVKAETVTYDEAKEPAYSTTAALNGKWFFANGTEVEIAEISDEKCATTDTAVAKYTWNEEEKYVCLTSDTTVLGGSEGKSNLEKSKIVMTGGTINSILGGGYSDSKDNVSKVANSEINVNGATLNNSTYGGGYGYSEVSYAKITVSDSIYSSKNWAGIIGGGASAVTLPNSTFFEAGTGSYDGMKASGNRVETVEIILDGATVTEGTKGVVYAGGQGYSYVGNSYVFITGESNIDYLTSGGSHGYTGVAEIEVEDGNVGVLQSVNRGFVDEAYISVTGGEVTNLYIGGETEDSSVNGLVKDVNVSISGGLVSNLENGTNAGIEMDAEATNTEDYIGYVEYVTAYVTNDNLSLPENVFVYPISLTSETDKIIGQIEDENDQVVIIVDEESNESAVVDSTVFETLAEVEDKQLIVTEKSNSYIWAFDSNSIGEFANDVNTSVSISIKVPEDLTESVKGYENIVLLDFAHSGNLPENTMFMVEIDSELEDKLSLYYYNEKTKEYELVETEVVYTESMNDGKVYASFVLEHCSSYMLASEVVEEMPPKTGDNIITYVIIGIVSILGLAVVGLKNKKMFN